MSNILKNFKKKQTNQLWFEKKLFSQKLFYSQKEKEQYTLLILEHLFSKRPVDK